MPPAGLDSDPMFSGYALLLPYLEQSALWEVCSTAISENRNTTVWSDWWFYPSSGASQIGETVRRGFSTLSFMQCPTRRSGSSSVDTGFHYFGKQGPRGDYGIVTAVEQPAGADSRWAWAGAQINPRSTENGSDAATGFGRYFAVNCGPFRAANYSTFNENGTGRASTWSTRDTFSRLS